MSKKAKILSIQYNPKIGDKMTNCEFVGGCISKSVEQNSKIDLVIMSEFFSTNIDDKSFLNFPEIEENSEVLGYFCEVAKEKNVNIICGSVVEKDKTGKLFNTSYAINREGEIIEKYRKIHLYNYLGGSEGKKICAGDTPKVVNFDFGRVGMSICFDIRYPLLYKKLIKMGAQIIVSPSAWCHLTSISKEEKESFIKTWQAFNISRAAENLIYFISTNLVGKSYPFLNSIGNSMAVSPLGEVLFCADENESVNLCEVDLGLVEKLHKEYPICEIE